MPGRAFVEAQASGDGGIENPEQNEADRDDRDDRDGEIGLKRCHAPNYRDRIALNGDRRDQREDDEATASGQQLTAENGMLVPGVSVIRGQTNRRSFD